MTQPQPCPEPAALHGLLQGVLAPEEQARLVSHLDTCLTCQQTLEGLAGGSQSRSEAVRHLAGDQPAAGLAYQQALEEIKGKGPEPVTVLKPTASASDALDFLDPPEEPGRLGRLGPYEIIEEIGRGGMGIVLKGFDAPLQRWVAVKVLAPHLAAEVTARQRFLREARAAAAVVHEYVVTIHAVGEANDTPYLVMEYVLAESLQERLDQARPFDLPEILRIGMQAASGLAAAHDRGLIHRDIKPANILLERGTGKVKITDFGLARAVTEVGNVTPTGATVPAANVALSQPGAVAGTPHYMAPEQARALPVDHRADLFSLGGVLYALCTGRSPFAGDTLMTILHQVCEDTPRPIRELRPGLPAWLTAVIDKLLAKNPAERFQSAAEVADVLRRHLAISQLTSVTPKQVRRLLGSEYRSRRILWGLPLVHVATGVDPHTGRMRVARGVIAVGTWSVGVVAIGGGAVGGIAIGGLACGLVGFGGLALGLVLALGGLGVGGVAVGGVAIGGVAIGGMALGYYAIGGAVWGVHALGGNVRDPQAVAFFRHWLGGLVDWVGRHP